MSNINYKLPTAPVDWNQAWGNRLVNTLEIQIKSIQGTASSDPFQISNVTTDRVLNADSTSTAELADVLGTLINDLKSKVVIS